MTKAAIFATALLASSVAGAAIDALSFSSPQQEADYHSLTEGLRCPQCQNNNIADSNATVAVDMRGKVFELLQEGKSKEQVVDYMVQRYGHFVTYDPPITAATWVLWAAPIVLLLGGVAWLFRSKKRSPTESELQTVLDDSEQSRLNELLKEKDK